MKDPRFERSVIIRQQRAVKATQRLHKLFGRIGRMPAGKGFQTLWEAGLRTDDYMRWFLSQPAQQRRRQRWNR